MLYIDKYQGYIADVPNIEFVRCDGIVFAYDELTSASMTAGHNMITITGENLDLVATLDFPSVPGVEFTAAAEG